MQLRAPLGGIALAILAALAFPANAKPTLENTDLVAERIAIEQFQARDQRLQDVGWAMARGNAAFCSRTIPSVGLLVQDMRSYGYPEIARAALGLKGDFAVQAAARGSPSALSGAFPRNREITAINALNLAAIPAGPAKSFDRTARVRRSITDVLQAQGSASFRFGDGSAATLTPVTICKARFDIIANSKIARGGVGQVALGDRFPAFAWSEEVFAGVVAHELAHVVLEHQTWLVRNKRKRKHVRLTEREADRLMPWLMANAGYDPQYAVTFMETWGKKHDPGLFRSGAYEGWDERAEHIAAELPMVRALIARDGKADWSRYFRREIDPRKGLDVAQRN